jgi:FtsP/CotA-like multicopper oxidase with cupredoxin domain
VRLLSRVAPVLVAGAVIAGLTWAAAAWNASRVPARYGVMEFGAVDLGGGPAASHGGHGHGLSVASFHEPETGPPDVRVTLVARHAKVRLPSGDTVDAMTFNGTVPGPDLLVRQGGLVEVTLVNRDLEEGVSIHWHGVDVPNAEDGVAGVTQDAVPVGGRFVYRFRADQPGTYWYHSHQDPLKEVERGLYGAFVVAPADRALEPVDVTLIAHTLGGASLLGASDVPARRAVAPGTPVRLRLVNADNVVRRFALAGTGFRVAAIDGGDLYRPPTVEARTLAVAAGGRYDVVFPMPAHPVSLGVRGSDAALGLSPDGGAEPIEPDFSAEELDPAEYARHETGIAPGSRFDRTFSIDIGRRLGFLRGGFKLGWQWTINGKTFPDMPMLVVKRGELVRISFHNGTGDDHPMHLHGHHMLVIARDGRPVATPWLVDTLNVRHDERYDVAVRAENPGLWMLHCHNLQHAAQGFTTHLVYDGVSTPFLVGKDSGNTPE